MKKIILLSVVTFMFTALRAQTFHDPVSGLLFNITSSVTPYTVEVGYNQNVAGNIVIPATVSYNGLNYDVTRIGDRAFQYCNGLTSVTIPNSVTSIGYAAFRGCISLTSINIPESVTSIGNQAFSYCSGLTSIIIPNSVISIENEAFDSCSAITSITIPNSVTSIANRTFSNCTSLTSVTIPNSVTLISYDAFWRCTALSSITIPNSVTSIEGNIFHECTQLREINVDSSNQFFSSIDGVLFSKDQTTLRIYPNAKGASYTIPSHVTSIGFFAFSGCSALSSITIPGSVTSIGTAAFMGCTAITSISIPGSVTSIGESTFKDCTALTSINIPESVTSIGAGTFGHCYALTSIIIPNTVTSIGYQAFESCNSLTSIDIPNSVTLIEFRAFFSCRSLTSIRIPNSVTSIGYSAFENCTSLTSLSIPNTVILIERQTFFNCTNLTSITIPNSVTSIGEWAFLRCTALTSIISLNVNPPTTSQQTFSDLNVNNCVLFVPVSAVEAYKASPGWKDFKILAIGSPYFTYSNPNFYTVGTPINDLVPKVVNSADNYSISPALPDGLTLDASTGIISGTPSTTSATTTYRVTATNTNGTNYFDINITVLSNQFKILVNPDEARVKRGETFELNILANLLTQADNVISYQFDLNFHPAIVQYIDNPQNLSGTMADGGVVLVNKIADGHLRFGYMRTNPLVGTGSILKLQFQGLLAGVSPVTLSNINLNDNSVTNIKQGQITVYTIPTCNLTYSDAKPAYRKGDVISITATFSEAMSDYSPQISLNGANTLWPNNMIKLSDTEYSFTYTVEDGDGVVNVSVTGFGLYNNPVDPTPVSGGSFNVIPLRYGDVNDDGRILAYDAALVLQYSVGMDPLTAIDPLPWDAWRVYTADVDGNSNVDSYDASLILQRSIGLLNSLHGQQMRALINTTDADISVEVNPLNSTIIFKSGGDLLGLNVSVDANREVLGNPEFLLNSYITASNINATNYRIGIASAYPIQSGKEFMRIPYIVNSITNISFNLSINGIQKTIDLALTPSIQTGIHNTGANQLLKLYPVPVQNFINIESKETLKKIEIQNIAGLILQTIDCNSDKVKVNFESIKTGIYFIRVRTVNDHVLTSKFEVK